MRFCDTDEVKIVSLTKDKLFFGEIENVSSFLKKKGVILKREYSKGKKMNTYLVEFDEDKSKRWWFLETELYLV